MYEIKMMACDSSNANRYVTVCYREAGKTVREQHWIFPYDGRGVIKFDINTFKPGRGRYQVGDRLMYTGKGQGYVEDVMIGTLATIMRDFGYDHRYWLEFDQPTNVSIWSLHPEGEFKDRTGIRTGGSGWTKI